MDTNKTLEQLKMHADSIKIVTNTIGDLDLDRLRLIESLLTRAYTLTQLLKERVRKNER